MSETRRPQARASSNHVMATVPDTYTPGNQCGSTALRNLLAFHGVEISEEMAFGLGAGACFYYVTLEDASPSRWFNGRTARLEESFRDLTGAALEMRTFAESDGDAWEAARAEVDAGNPVLLLTDLYYLDHYGNSAHFPGHAVVLAGYDDELAYLSDTAFDELQTTRLENLDKARQQRPPRLPLDRPHFTVGARSTARSWRRAVPRAIAKAARRWSSRPGESSPACPLVERLAAEAGSWPRRRGLAVVRPLRLPGDRAPRTGGGAFRLIYSRFLEESPARGSAAAERRRAGTELAEAFQGGDRERGAGSRPLACRRHGGAAGGRGRDPALADAPPASDKIPGLNPG